MNPYIGITGFTSRQQVEQVLSGMPDLGDRKLMVGVLASSKTLSGQTNRYPFKYPPVGTIPSIFSPDARCLNLIHFSTDNKDDLYLQCEQLIARCKGVPLHGFQLNVVWPNPYILLRLKERYGVKIVLQLGATALSKCEYEKGLRAQLESYLAVGASRNISIIDYVLLDLSGGKGKDINIPFTLRCIDELLKVKQIADGTVLIGAAGGLSHETVNILAPVAERYPELCCDAEGKLVGYGDRTSDEFVRLSVQYVEAAKQVLQR